MKTFKFALFFGVIVAMLALYADVAVAAQRVLLIGDETVVESAARPDGFTNLLRQFTAEEGQDVEFVPLGVNHATFADWRALLEKSNNENVPIDVEGVDLKDELDKGADVVVIFLGINDALKPSFRGFDGRVYQHIGNHVSTLSSAVGQWANKIGEPLRANVSGLVADVKKRVPGCRVVIADLYEENSSFLNPSAIKFVSRQILSATREQCDHIAVDLFFRNAFEAARFSDEEIRFTRDGLRLNEYGSQLMAWGTLLALVSNRTFDDVLKRAKNAYWTDLAENIAPEPPFDEWEKLARRFYENKVDRRLRDFHSPGFSLYAERWTFTVDERDVPDKYRVVLRCETRGIEATEPVKARNDGVHPMTARVDKIPKIEIVSCGNLQFNQLDVNRSVDFRDKNGASRGAYTLEFYGTPKDFPVDVVLAIGAVQKKIHFFTSGSCNISGVFPLEEEFSNLDDFPQEKAITSVDYVALAGHNPASWRFKSDDDSVETGGMGGGDAWLDFPRRNPDGSYRFDVPNPAKAWRHASSVSTPLVSYRYEGADPDPNWFNLAATATNDPFSGVYVVRVFDSPNAQDATLKLGVGGYKTHVVERVYFNGVQVFFGELDVDDSKKREVSVPTRVKAGRNIMVARVDRTQWDWIVGFTLLDEEGNALQDSLERR